MKARPLRQRHGNLCLRSPPGDCSALQIVRTIGVCWPKLGYLPRVLFWETVFKILPTDTITRAFNFSLVNIHLAMGWGWEGWGNTHVGFPSNSISCSQSRFLWEVITRLSNDFLEISQKLANSGSLEMQARFTEYNTVQVLHSFYHLSYISH